jgi:hypothetical protein
MSGRSRPLRAIITRAAVVFFTMIGFAVVGCGPGSTKPSDPSATPAASASPSASEITGGGPIPAELRSRWMGGHRDVPGIRPAAGTSILFSEDDFAVTQSGGSEDRHLLSSSASMISEGQIRLEQIADAEGCSAGDVGLYAWSLSPSGRTLTISGAEDECSTRLAAMQGVWWRMACKDPYGDFCLGDLDAGTYGSEGLDPRMDPGAGWNPVFGALTYTVPDGWANDADWPTRFSLVPSSDFANVPDRDVDSEILLFTQPIAQSQENPCSIHDGEPQPGVGRTVDDLIAWLHQVPGLRATDPMGITIAGHSGKSVDLSLEPDWTGTPDCDVLEFIKASDGGPVAIAGVIRERLILLNLGQGDVLAIRIFTRDPARFDAVVAEAMPIIESFRFK